MTAEATNTTANQRAADAAQVKAPSGAAKRAAMASGKPSSGSSGLAAMWSKAPTKKPIAKATASGKPAPTAAASAHAATDANEALQNAQEVGMGTVCLCCPFHGLEHCHLASLLLIIAISSFPRSLARTPLRQICCLFGQAWAHTVRFGH